MQRVTLKKHFFADDKEEIDGLLHFTLYTSSFTLHPSRAAEGGDGNFGSNLGCDRH